jgi:serine/threonine protein kinase
MSAALNTSNLQSDQMPAHALEVRPNGVASDGSRAGMEARAFDERRFGPYSFVRPLEHGRLGERWLAMHDRDLTSHVVHRLPVRPDNHSRRKFLRSVQPVAELSQAHILSVEQYSLDVSGRGCVVTPFTGNSDGLLTLGGLLLLKAGRMLVPEAARGIRHLLEASAHAHERGVAHGPLTLDQILVDRHGCLQIELYGMERVLAGRVDVNDELVRGEVASIVAIGYRLITGFRPDTPPMQHVPPSEVLKKLVDGPEHTRKIDAGWDQFFAKGLDEIEGFASAAEAIAAMPGETPVTPATESISVRALLAKLVEKVRKPAVE